MPDTENFQVVRQLLGSDGETSVVRELSRFADSMGFDSNRFYDVVDCPFRQRAFFVLRWTNQPNSRAGEGYRIEDTFGLVQRLLDGPAVWTEGQLSGDSAREPWVSDLALHGQTCVDLPIRDDNELIGVFSVSRPSTRAVLVDELASLSTIALLAGARLSSMRRRLNARLLAEMLSSVDSHARSEVLATALGKIGEAVDAHRVSFFIRAPGGQRLRLFSEVRLADQGGYVSVDKAQRSGSSFLRELAEHCWDDETMRFVPTVDGLPAVGSPRVLGRDRLSEDDADVASVMHVKLDPFDSEGALIRVLNRASNGKLLFTAANRESLHQLAIPFRQLMMTMDSALRLESLWKVLSESLNEIQTEGLNFRAIASFLKREDIIQCGVASFTKAGSVSDACRVTTGSEVASLRIAAVAGPDDLARAGLLERGDVPSVLSTLVDSHVDLVYVVPFIAAASGRSDAETTICVFALHAAGDESARQEAYWRRQRARLHMLDIVGRLIGVMRELTRNRRLLYLAEEAVGTIGHEIRSPAGALYNVASEIRAVSEQAIRGLAKGSQDLAIPACSWDASTDTGSRALKSSNEVLAWLDRGGQLLGGYRDRLRRVVDDAIRWARLGGKSLEVSFERVSIPLLVEEALIEVRGELAAKPYLRIEVDPTVQRLEPIVADRFLVKILLANLLDNAIKYSHSRDPRWRLSDREAIRFTSSIVLRAERQANLIDLFITNWGLGIDVSDYQNIFSSFYRSAVRDRLHTVRGVGLGLPTCRKIVLVHRGSIHVKSRPTLQDPEKVRQKEGYETTFTVRLPLDLKPGRFDIDMAVINAGQ